MATPPVREHQSHHSCSDEDGNVSPTAQANRGLVPLRDVPGHALQVPSLGTLAMSEDTAPLGLSPCPLYPKARSSGLCSPGYSWN